MRQRSWCVLGPFLLTACALDVATTPLNASPRALSARPVESVQVFTNSTPVGAVAVALITVKQESGFSDATALIPTAREKAAEMGCDGLAIVGANNRVVGSADGGTGTLAGYDFSCLVFSGAADSAPIAGATPSPASLPADRAGLTGACEQKDGAACHSLGEDLETGKSGPKDLAAAAGAYDKSCALGSKNDCRRRDLLRKKI